MRYSFIIPAIFAASTLAAPAVEYVTHVQVVHVTVTEGAGAAPQATQGHSYPVAAPQQAKSHKAYKHQHLHTKKPVIKTVYQSAPPAAVQTYAPAPAPVESYPVAPAPQPTTSTEAPAPVETYKPAPQPSTTSQAPASTPSSSSSSSGNIPQSGGQSVLEIFNKYRRKYGMKDATWSDSLANNAYLTGQGGDGHVQKHILPTLTSAGSCAQVITPGADQAMDGYGDYTPFDIAMLSWLCEVSTDSEISSECPQAVKANGMTFVETAHHDDLVNPEYNQVGIAYYANPNPSEDTPWRGLWVASLES